jgi:predicted CXXCH cytochrome family protein
MNCLPKQRLLFSVAFAVGLACAAPVARGQTVDLPAEYSCSLCHRKEGELWNENTPIADESHLSEDIHWQKGLRCHDCHGGAATLDEFKNHRDDPTFRSVRQRAGIPGFCGHCHSSIETMRRYAPSARTDQEAEYWTSGHGRRLKATSEGEAADPDKAVATCVDCHGRHGILAVKNPNSPVYPLHVAQTCARCHADASVMAGRTYNDRPLGHAQFAEWRRGVHGRALLEKGDLSAATCNDCHGNHGAMPPGVDSVANACGTCHGKIANLFAETSMKHKFQEAGLPGCATCHGTHETTHPSDAMLGMSSGAVCARCHNPENPQYGATVAGADAARSMRERLEQLKREVAESEELVKRAERLGMEVRGPRFDLRQAFDALTNARTLVHNFKPAPLEATLGEGLKVTQQVKQLAGAALAEHTHRRQWLAASLVPILLVVGLLLAYIRTLPPPALVEDEHGGA